MGRGTVRGEEGAGRGRRGGRAERAMREGGGGQGGDRGANRSWIDGSNTRTASYAQRPGDDVYKCDMLKSRSPPV